MGVVIPQVITEDKAGGAQIIDGGLRFNANFYLSRTPGSAGNRRTWTWSGWVKRSAVGTKQQIFGVTGTADADYCENYFGTDNKLYLRYGYTSVGEVVTTQVFRDVSSWYHILFAFDATQSTASNKLKLYINGVEVTSFSTDTRSSLTNTDWAINRTGAHYLSTAPNGAGTEGLSALLSNVYFIDGQALDPSYFGYTDPLTNTWRPKKLSSSIAFGTNGFYLPLDGNTPIGQDQSGRGNNWTPVNFGGSNTLEKATGALPILNTDGGGKVARVGVRTDSNASSLVLALPLVGIKSDFSNAVNSGTSNKAVTASNSVASSSQSNFYGGSWYFDGSGDTLYAANSADFNVGSGNFTVEMWLYPTAVGTSRRIFLWNGDNAGTNTSNTLWAEINTSSKVFMGGSYGSSSIVATSSQNILANTWTHVAFVRNGNTGTLYMNGVADGTADLTGITFNNSVDPLKLGDYKTTGDGFPYSGYIQDFRIYKGVAKYTQNFIPASTDPDILPDTPSGVAYSSNVALVPSTDGAVAFDGSGDYLSLADSADWTLGSGDFTIEAFVYAYSFGSYEGIVGQWPQNGGNVANSFVFEAVSGNIEFYYSVGSTLYGPISGGALTQRKWQHLAAVRSGNTMYIFVDGILTGSGSVSLTFNDAASPLTVGGNIAGAGMWNGFISNVHIVKGTALYTSNFTPPTAPITSVANTKLLCCKSNSNPKLADSAPNIGITTNTQFNTNFETIPTTVNGISITNNGSVSTTSAGTNSFGFTNGANLTGSNSLTANIGTVPALSTIDLVFKVNGTVDNKYLFGMSANGLVRRSSSNLAWYNGSTDQTVYTSPDDGAWHHLRVTPTDLYFDGTRIQNTGSLANINNEGVAGNNGGLMAIGAYRDSSQTTYNGAVIFGLVRIMPGVDLGAPTVPITTNGTLSGSATIPNDGIIIRNGNTAASNFNPFTVNINTQRGQESGYATWNPLDTAGSTLSNGNLNITTPSSGLGVTRGTIGVSSGKWYYEHTIISGATAVGIMRLSDAIVSSQILGATSGGYSYYSEGVAGGGYTKKINNNTQVDYGTSFDPGDTISVAFDLDVGTITFYKNGISQGVAYSGLSGIFAPAISDGTNAGSIVGATNFGQKPFKFPPPAGFQPLALANTPRPTIVRPDQYVGVTTFTGTGQGTTTTVSNLQFKPDFVWTKSRAGARNHGLYDSVRGINRKLYSSADFAENTGTTLTSFDRNGFKLADGDDIVYYGESGVAWCWKAGGNSNTFNINDVGYATTTAAGLTAGTIAPTGASVNTKSGFSIIAYTGTGNGSDTVPHGLGKAPSLIFVKSRNSTVQWVTYHSSLGKDYYDPGLNTTNTANSSSNYWGSGGVTSTVFGLQNSPGGGSGNNSLGPMIAYCWAEIPGFSKFGSYTGNGSTDGPMVVTGFRPRWIIVKDTTTGTTNWRIWDSVRGPYNPNNIDLLANTAEAENTYGSDEIDILSNGFKIRSTGSWHNSSGDTYIYAAFAESPSFNLYGGQSNAR